MGLIGLGRVGTEVAKIGKAFGMQVMAWSENLDLDKCKKLDVLPCSKDDLISNSDFLSIHRSYADEFKFTGTPATIIGNQIIPGFIDADKITEILEKEFS